MNLLGHNSPSPWPRRIQLRRLLWVIVESTLFRRSPTRCYRWRNRLLRWFGATINDTPDAPARVWSDAAIYFPWHLTLGAGCLLGPQSRVYNLGRITVGPGANLSRNVHLCAGSHDYRQWSMPLLTEPIVIGTNVWIATDVFVGPGVTIGDECVVGARSVVIKSLPPGMICVGHPCHPVKARPPLP